MARKKGRSPKLQTIKYTMAKQLDRLFVETDD